jgi:cell division septum initiation protein DivIVA
MTNPIYDELDRLKAENEKQDERIKSLQAEVKG